MMSGNCGNCLHNCCCTCKNPDCSPCKGGRCQYYGTDHKRVCFNCKKAIKSQYHYSIENCIHCKGKTYKVSQVLRTPKQSDKAGWILLEKLITCPDIRATSGLGAYWKSSGTIGCKQHATKGIRDHIWIPRTQYEYKRWVIEMNRNRTNNSRNE
jgi:hypothetical protein